MSNILDKPLESVFGYISVLPGAFSAYRYAAVQGRPLTMYLKGEALHEGNADDIFAANMYLAEDRVLCFEIVTKRESSWLLKYVKGAKAETDVPDTVPEFISQRRRWLNGSFFASVHALTHWYYIFRSDHNILRKFGLCVQFIYNLVNLAFMWFGLATFYLTFFFLSTGIATDALNDPFHSYGVYIMEGLRQLYILTLVLVVISSLGNRPQGSKFIYIFAIVMFAIIMGMMLFLGGYIIYTVVRVDSILEPFNFVQLLKKSAFRDMFISLCSTWGLYILSSLVYMDPWHMATSFIQYLFFLPTFQNIIQTYAFCNINDLAWGTKGDNSATVLGSVDAVKGKDGKERVQVEVPTDRADLNQNFDIFVERLAAPRSSGPNKVDAKTAQEDYFKNFRTKIVLGWMFSNFLVVFVLSNSAITNVLFPILNIPVTQGFNPFLLFIFYSVMVLSGIRFIGSMFYLATYSVFGS